jgi:hypothetical protein
MQHIEKELADDTDSRNLFFETIFEKLHLQLTDIKVETFQLAE